jgi:DNA-binding transcriptional regulator YiaG
MQQLKLLTYEDLAEILNTPVNTIKDWSRKAPDRLPPRMKMGRNVRFHPDTVTNWLKAKDAQGQRLFGSKA